MNRAKATVVLLRHGVDPNADADTLVALLAARGWQASVEETGRNPAAGPKTLPRGRVAVAGGRPVPGPPPADRADGGRGGSRGAGDGAGAEQRSDGHG